MVQKCLERCSTSLVIREKESYTVPFLIFQIRKVFVCFEDTRGAVCVAAAAGAAPPPGRPGRPVAVLFRSRAVPVPFAVGTLS